MDQISGLAGEAPPPSCPAPQVQRTWPECRGPCSYPLRTGWPCPRQGLSSIGHRRRYPVWRRIFLAASPSIRATCDSEPIRAIVGTFVGAPAGGPPAGALAGPPARLLLCAPAGAAGPGPARPAFAVFRPVGLEGEVVLSSSPFLQPTTKARASSARTAHQHAQNLRRFPSPNILF